MVVILGAIFGIAIGALNHWLLRRAVAAGPQRDAGHTGRLVTVFGLRYTALALALLLFWLAAHDAGAEIALALAALGSSRLLLLRTFPPGGDLP